MLNISVSLHHMQKIRWRAEHAHYFFLLDKMSRNYWQKFAGLRLFFYRIDHKFFINLYKKIFYGNILK